MFNKKGITQLGKAHIQDMGLGKYSTFYRTEFYANRNDSELMTQLQYLGFNLTPGIFGQMFGTLPEGWTHIRLNIYEERILDSYGRTRIEIDNRLKSCKLITRFTYELSLIQRPEDGVVLYARFSISDGIQMVHDQELHHEDFYTLCEESFQGDVIATIKFLEDAVLAMMETTFPGWQDPLHYWD